MDFIFILLPLLLSHRTKLVMQNGKEEEQQQKMRRDGWINSLVQWCWLSTNTTTDWQWALSIEKNVCRCFRFSPLDFCWCCCCCCSFSVFIVKWKCHSFSLHHDFALDDFLTYANKLNRKKVNDLLLLLISMFIRWKSRKCYAQPIHF